MRMRCPTVVLNRLLLALLLACCLSSVRAQSEEIPSATSSIGDRTISQMADAYDAIDEIRKQAQDALSVTEDEAAAQAVIESAERAMVRAVESTGLKVREFNRLAELAALDPSLGARIEDRRREREPI